MHASLLIAARKAREFGLVPYAPVKSSPGLDTYMYVTDGTRIGYLQVSRFGDIARTTVHIPNRTTGTGYGLDGSWGGISPEAITKDWLEESFKSLPGCGVSMAERESVRKFASWADFAKGHAWCGGLAEVEGV